MNSSGGKTLVRLPVRKTSAPPERQPAREAVLAAPVRRWRLNFQVKELLSAYSSILLIDHPVLGLGLLLASFVEREIALCGLLSLLASWFYLQALNLKVPAFRSTVLYNGLLIGLFIGYVFQLDIKVAFLILLASAFGLMCTAVADSILHFYALPVLSLPFTLCALLLSLAKPKLSYLSISAPYRTDILVSTSDFVNTCLKSMGAIFCIPNPIFGLLMVVMLLLASPLTALFFASGFYLGHLLESTFRLGQPDSHLMHQFNYALSFAGVGLIFLKPSIRSILAGGVAIAITMIVALGSSTFWEAFQVPLVPFSFNLTVLFLLRAFQWMTPGAIRDFPAATPEEALDALRLYRLRQRSGEIGIFCPFVGAWAVQQGFDGKWTHRGNWKHALDFVKLGSNGRTYSNQGFDLKDYYCFAQPVISPVDGIVISVEGNLPDNPIGTVDNQHNWGNYIILRANAGYHVLLTHLKQGSVLVKVGDSVRVASPLAQCGNSGYSQEPHLHLQVQWSSVLGGYTTPFHLVNYRRKNELVFMGVPLVGEELEPFSHHLPLERAMGFKIGEVLCFSLKDAKSANAKRVEIKVELDEKSGAIFLADGDSRLFLGRSGAVLYFYGFKGKRHSPLAHLFRAAPRVPLIFGERASFEDALPAKLSQGSWGVIGRGCIVLQELFGLGSSNQLNRFQVDSQQLEIHGEGTLCKVDPLMGIVRFSSNERVYERNC